MVLTPVMRRKLAERSKKTKGLVWLPLINNRILGNYTGFDPNLAGGRCVLVFLSYAVVVDRTDGNGLGPISWDLCRE